MRSNLRMKIVMLFTLIVLVVADDEDYFTTGDDHIDVDALLADRVRAKQYLDCYLDKGPCTELSSSYKKIIPESVENACKRCNHDQEHIFWQFLKGIKVIFPEEYRSLRQKYDPENKYFEALEKEVSQY